MNLVYDSVADDPHGFNRVISSTAWLDVKIVDPGCADCALRRRRDRLLQAVARAIHGGDPRRLEGPRGDAGLAAGELETSQCLCHNPSIVRRIARSRKGHGRNGWTKRKKSDGRPECGSGLSGLPVPLRPEESRIGRDGQPVPRAAYTARSRSTARNHLIDAAMSRAGAGRDRNRDSHDRRWGSEISYVL